jgi:hypothetical protein
VIEVWRTLKVSRLDYIRIRVELLLGFFEKLVGERRLEIGISQN